MSLLSEGWIYRRKLTLSNTHVDSNQSNFPIVVTEDALDDTHIFAHARSDGGDIRFSTDLNGASGLNADIPHYSAGSEELEAHVRIPTLNSGATTIIYIWYGKGSATIPVASDSTWGSQGVWDSSYETVHHLESASSILDSTSNGNNGNNNGADLVTGKLGNGLDFVAANSDYVSLVASAINQGDEISFELWSYGDAAILPADTLFFEARDVSSNRVAGASIPFSNSGLYWDYGNATYERISVVPANNDSDFEGQWNHWVFTKDASGSGWMYMYLNGALYHSGSGFTKTQNTANTFTMGSRTDMAGSFYDGVIEEIMYLAG